MKHILSVCLLLVVSTVHSQYIVNDDAYANAQCGCYTLTDNAPGEAGSAWNQNQISLTNSFDFTFQIYLGCNGLNGGADGMAFALQQVGTNVGTAGGGMGIMGVAPSVAVIFDTYNNGVGDGDIPQDHISINANGNINHDGGIDDLAGPLATLELEDCAWHDFQVIWNPSSLTLTVFLDGVLYFNYTGDIVNTIFGGNPNVFFGFTGGTGWAANQQMFCTEVVASFNASNLATCVGDQISFTDASTSGGPITNWNWDFGDGNTSTAQNPFHTYSTPGIYNVNLQVTDMAGCIDNTTTTVVVIQPMVTATSTAVSCNGACDGTVTASVTGGVPGSTFVWDNGLGTGSTINNVCAGGPYTVTVTTVNGCTATANVMVTEPAVLVGNLLSTTNATCGNANGAVALNASGGTTPYTFDIGIGSQPTGIFSGLLPGNHTCTITDANGCTTQVPFTITEPPALVGSIAAQVDVSCNSACNGTVTIVATGGTTPYSFNNGSGPQVNGSFTNLCAGANNVTVTDGNGCTFVVPVLITEPTAIVLDTTSNSSHCGQPDGSVGVTATGGTVDIDYNYVWTDASANVVANTAIANNLPTGNYTVVVTDDNGCTATITATIVDIPGGTVSAAVTSNYNGSQVSCNAACDGEITISTNGGTAPFIVSVNNIVQTGTVITGLCAGTYLISVIDAVGCTATTSVTITEPAPLSASTIVINESCIGDCSGSITLAPSGGTPGYSYTFDNGVTYGAGDDLGSLCAGNYNVGVMDANGCQTNFIVDVVPGQPYADATINPTGPHCINAAAITLTAISSGGIWSGVGVIDPLNGTFDPSVAGVGTTAVTYTIGGACGDVQTTDVIVNPLPLVAFAADVTTGCEPFTVNFTNTGATGNCSWDFGDGNTSLSCGPVSHTYTDPGTYDVTLTVKDGNGCLNSFTAVNYITVHPNPIADFTFEPQPTTIMDPMIEFTDYSSDAVLWNWDFAGLGTSTDQNPSFNFENPGSFDVELMVTSAEGCTDRITYTVEIGDETNVYVPNAFTPDGDGINDVFIPVLSGSDPMNYTFLIFDRWGKLIFESNVANVGWDGTYKGTAVQQGVYVWKLQARSSDSNKYIEKAGHVTLIK
jgi:gliding motility-associated-like protein